jgi:hypothetical protein
MAYFRNRKSGATRLRREMEIKEFRVACGEFVGLSDMSRKEWERPGSAFVPDGLPWARKNVCGTRPWRFHGTEDP